MAFSEQLWTLVGRLTTLTEERKIAWEETADEEAFQTAVSKFVVTIGKTSSWTDADYYVRILDERGKVIEDAVAAAKPRLSTKHSLLDALNEAASQMQSERVSLERLHHLARREALRVDDALTDLLSSLEKVS